MTPPVSPRTSQPPLTLTTLIDAVLDVLQQRKRQVTLEGVTAELYEGLNAHANVNKAFSGWNNIK